MTSNIKARLMFERGAPGLLQFVNSQSLFGKRKADDFVGLTSVDQSFDLGVSAQFTLNLVYFIGKGYKSKSVM